MSVENLKFASLFSGCGGCDIGFNDSGFQSFGAIDCDSEAIGNLRTNLNDPSYVAAEFTKQLLGKVA